MVDLQAGGTLLRLLSQRAVFLPEHKALLVADAHIGKAVSFRRLGVPVPGGTTSETLDRLSDALTACGAQQVIFLGDLLHSARSRAPATWAAVEHWRAAHRDITLTLVRGNHDSHAGDPPAEWHVTCVDEPLMLGGLALAHHPNPIVGAYVLAGHIHPAARIGGGSSRGRRGSGRGKRGGGAHDSLRLPCFHFGPQVGVLPAFGAFTGMHVMTQAPGDRVFVVADDEVRALNSAP
jgi:uncharacterized protein